MLQGLTTYLSRLPSFPTLTPDAERQLTAALLPPYASGYSRFKPLLLELLKGQLNISDAQLAAVRVRWNACVTSWADVK